MKKNWMSHIIVTGTFVVFIILVQACATTPTETVNLGESYREFLLPAVGRERVIDTVEIMGNTSFVCRDGRHAITDGQRLGIPYQVSVAEPQSGFYHLYSLLQHLKEELIDMIKSLFSINCLTKLEGVFRAKPLI
jgi:hypothetical protein